MTHALKDHAPTSRGPALIGLDMLIIINALVVVVSTAEAPRPHIVFALADDLGHANVGWNSGGKVLTPHLDQLRKEGLALDRHYVSARQDNCGH